MVFVFSGKSSSYSCSFFQCVKAAELIGTFVSPKVSLRLITSAFGKTPKPSCIMVLTAVIRGSPKEILQPHLTDLGNRLSEAGVCQRSEEVRVTGKYTTGYSFRPVVFQHIFPLFSLYAPISIPPLHTNPTLSQDIVVQVCLRQNRSFPVLLGPCRLAIPKNLPAVHPLSRCRFRFENYCKRLPIMGGK